MTTKGLWRLGFAGAVVLFLVACGQKGPLYMPDEQQDKQTENQKVEAENNSEIDSENVKDDRPEYSAESNTRGEEQ